MKNKMTLSCLSLTVISGYLYYYLTSFDLRLAFVVKYL